MKGEENERPYYIAVVQPCDFDTVQAFFTVETRDGLTIRGLTYHDTDGKKWIGLPGQPRLDSEGRAIRDQQGKIQHYRLLYFTGRDKWHAFQNWAISELDRILPALKQAKNRAPEFRGGAR